MKTSQALLLAAALSAGLLAATGANATLVGSADGKTVWDADISGGITWLSNANLAATETFGLSYGVNYGTDIYGNQSIINSNGSMTWGGAMKWIGAMNAFNGGVGYLGYNDWRLPTTLQPDASCGTQSGGESYGYYCTGSEMGHLFLSELGEAAGQPLSSSADPDKAKFTNLQSLHYWSGTEYAPVTNRAWNFNTNYGYQYADYKVYNMFAMAVRPGQVAAVPVPAAAWLLGSGLLGLIGVARRRLVL